jgi:hypothetical protein
MIEKIEGKERERETEKKKGRERFIKAGIENGD